MLKSPWGSQPKKTCDKCGKDKSKSNFAGHYRRCKGARAKMTKKEINQRYFANHKTVLKMKYQQKRAAAEFDKMKQFMLAMHRPIQCDIPDRPLFMPPPMTSSCPFFLMKDYDDLYINTAKVLLVIHDKFASHQVGSKKYMMKLILKCHPDKFASNIYAPRVPADAPRWKAAVQHFSSTLINIANINNVDDKFQEQIARQKSEFFACLEASRSIVEKFDSWKQACVEPMSKTTTLAEENPEEYRQGIEKWKEYLHCDTFDRFFEVWKANNTK